MGGSFQSVGSWCEDGDVRSESASPQLYRMQVPIICWDLGLKHVHAMAESVSASEQPGSPDAWFRHDICDVCVIRIDFARVDRHRVEHGARLLWRILS